MDETEDKEVSSSSSCSSSSPQDTQSPNEASPSCTGTPVSLKGRVWMEMENALVLNVDWKGRDFAGTLIKVNSNDLWGPQRLHDHPCQKIKTRKPRKNFTTKDNCTKQTQRKQETYSKKYPRSFVHTSNIVASKLRYGRDKRVASYSSCPSSPRPRNSNFRNRTSRNSINDINSASVSDSDIKCSSSNLKKCLNQNFTPESELPTLQSTERMKCNNEDETQCNEINSTRTSSNLVDEFVDNNKLEMDNFAVPSLSSYDIKETDGTIKADWSSTMSPDPAKNDERMPNLQPVEPHLPRLKKVAGTCSENSSNNTNGSINILESYSVMDNMPEANLYLQEAVPLTLTCTVVEQTNGNAAEVSRTDGVNSDNSESAKTYIPLKNCDTDFISNSDVSTKLYSSEGSFYQSSTLIENAAQVDVFQQEKENSFQPDFIDSSNSLQIDLDEETDVEPEEQ